MHPLEPIPASALDDLVNQIGGPLLILADVNAKSALWGFEQTNPRGSIIEKFIDKNDLNILNDGRTTYTSPGYGTSSSIDVSLCTPGLESLYSWNVLDDSYSSDHYPMVISSFGEAVENRRRQRWIEERADWQGFQRDIKGKFDDIESMDVASAARHLSENIHTAARVNIPMSRSSGYKRKVPWWSNALARLIRRKRRLGKKIRNNPPQAILDAYKIIRSEVKRAVLAAKQKAWKDYVESIGPDTPSKEVWEKIRRINGKSKSNAPREIIGDNGYSTDPTIIAEALAAAFCKNSDDSHLQQQDLERRQELTVLNIVPERQMDEVLNARFCFRELEKALNSVSGKSCGPDNISYTMLKNLPDSEKQKLLVLYNKAFMEGHFPDEWKSAIVIPILKPGKQPLDPSSYRPISLLSCVGKVMEKMVADRLMWWLEKHKLLPANQAGFRKNRSTADNLAYLQHYVADSLNSGQHVYCVSFDLEKAYERVWRIIIINQLKQWGVEGEILRFVVNFLSNRDFRVAVGDSFSSTRIQINGVPTGSIFSVPLFLIAMSGASHALSCCKVKHLLYADDLVVFARSKDISAMMEVQKAVKLLEKWSNDYGFRFSAQKSKAIHFCRRGYCPVPVFTLYGSQLEVEDSVRILGVLFDKKLSFKEHLTELKISCTKRLQIIKSLSNSSWGADRSQLLQVSQALIGGKCDYGIQAYGSASVTTLNKINGPYNAAIRVSIGAFRSSPTISVHAEANVPSLEERRHLALMKWSNKVRNDPTHALHQQMVSSKPQKKRRLTSIVDHCRQLSITYNVPKCSLRQRKPLLQAPWFFNAEAVDISLSQHRKKDTHPLEYKSLVLERLERMPECKLFYTDGSKQAEGVGLGVFGVYPDTRLMIKLREESSIFTAEATAILHCLKYKPGDYQAKSVLTDSLSVCNAVLGFDSQNLIIAEIRDLLIESPQHKIIWIPGHCDIPGNEVADHLAKESITRVVPDLLRLPLEDLQRATKASWRNKKGEIWTSIPTDNMLKSICESPSTLFHPSNLSRRQQCILTRLRIGHTRLTHKYLMEGRQQCDICDVCEGDKPLTVKHVIEECKKYSVIRNSLGDINLKLIGDKSDEKTIKKVIDFIIKNKLDKEI